MKKSFLLIPFLGVMLAGCSNENLVEEGLSGGKGDLNSPMDFVNEYLSLKIVPTSGMGTRAAEGTYQDGSETESSIKAVRFFFFDNEGKAVPVAENRGDGTYNSFVDWYPNENEIKGGNDAATVETSLRATLGLVTPANTNPASVVAIINPTSQLLNYPTPNPAYTDGILYGPSLSDLQGATYDKDYLTGCHSEGTFVMSNSVYVKTENGNAEVVDATAITEDNFATTPEEFESTGTDKKPITIYVERVLARLDFGISSIMEGIKVGPEDTGKTTIYKVGEYTIEKSKGEEEDKAAAVDDDEPEDADGEGDGNGNGNGKTNVYVKFLGWNVTATSDKSRLIKSVNTEWQDGDILGTKESLHWNTADYNRSFWALNPSGVTYQYGDFDGETEQNDDDDSDSETDQNPNTNVNPASALTIADAGKYTFTYLQENANEYSANAEAKAPETKTKVIIAAQLCNEDGDALEIAEFNFRKYAGRDALLTYLVGHELANLYYKTVDQDKETYDQITKGDLVFKTAKQLNKNSEYEASTGDEDYYVYVVLKDAAKDWYVKNTDETYTRFEKDGEADIQGVNKYIYNRVPRARVWNTGKTYYYFDVKHLGDTGTKGEYGIVRNHIYRTTVKSVEGIGTPVFDPDQEIIPKQNTYDESIVVADVEVLQWRVVESDYDLKWK